ncbi:tRNA pseudouridine38-40 synthase [Methanohalophilus levihalophilus]|uniref:tRNA pseudouridine(38-40) synthase TruA n=1 Tax=Methanohalophilus levihalophilus TaxID=1431282 RepID=UPI001AEB924D|nr:tRNA pseudouridine(38-40) synthase TruA [Methanohalophilus levihalophilus]MBP2029941.1 tRNA pseudouridine38-40 synthase [Methanohalophilus levihalophilus]
MRVALKIAYIGSAYHGLQIQPNVPTIEGKLFEALKELEVIDNPASANFVSSGRTDSGVNAMGQVVAFDTDKPNLAIPRVINSKLPNDIWAWAHAEVPDDFHPRRYARRRTYRYIVPVDDHDISLIRSASRILLGTHDFANFCVNEEGRSTIRTIEKIDVRLTGNLLKIDVEANSFLWKMVRKIVTSLMLVGSGERDTEWLEQMIQPEIFEEGLEPSAPYGLILLDVNYGKSVDWITDGYAVKRSGEKVQEYLKYHMVMAELMEQFLPREPQE